MRFIVILSVLSLASCSFFQEQRPERFSTGKEVVRVYDKVLYEGELKELMAGMQTETDSVVKSQYQIDKWIEKQIWLNERERLSANKQLEINELVERYREELIVYAVQNKLRNEATFPAVTDKEIADYYEQYGAEFKLSETIVQAVLVKCQKDEKKLSTAAKLVANYKAEDKDKLHELCTDIGESCHLDDTTWYALKNLLDATPFTELMSTSTTIKNGSFYRTTQGDFVYLLKIVASLSDGDQAPLTFIKGSVKQMIQNKKVFEGKNFLFDGLYEEAKKENEIEFY